MDMFEYYYPEQERSVTEEEYSLHEEEMELYFAIADFKEQIKRHGFLEMMRLLTQELIKDGYGPKV